MSIVTPVPTTDPGDIERTLGSEVAARPSLSDLARLGLPHDKQQVVRRVLMYLPWRVFVGPQVAFNKSAAKAIAALRRKSDRLESELAKADAAASAVREQLYDTEGELRRTLSDLQIQLARLEQRIGRS